MVIGATSTIGRCKMSGKEIFQNEAKLAIHSTLLLSIALMPPAVHLLYHRFVDKFSVNFASTGGEMSLNDRKTF